MSANRQVSSSGFLLTMATEVPSPDPGQFVMVGLPEPGAFFLRRPFSVFDFQARRKRLSVYYSVAGPGTEVLSRVRPGEKLSLLGPLGRGFPESPRRLHVMVGGGRGGAPLAFLSRRARKGKRVLFLVGARTEEHVLPLERIRASKIFVATEDGSLGMRGTVLDLLENVVSSPDFDWAEAALYGCGPSALLRKLHAMAVKRRVPCFVSLEARMGCGLGACQGCAVRKSSGGFFLVCKEGPVVDSLSVDWQSYSEVR
ncbi:MAG: dihydroorotate dehydrogenase electron transfer subunit [Candidatus Eiseniibacteriota bacterium]|nr:MAG: dihydroorotate dehydrogenase electron transfer subunit [Candidatus Eisenbacteria bacterium]